MEQETYQLGDWLTVFGLFSPSGCIDLGGRDKWGHYKEPALWPPTSCQRVPAGESPAVFPFAVLLCCRSAAELSAYRWTLHPCFFAFCYFWGLCVPCVCSSPFLLCVALLTCSFSPYSHSGSDCQLSPAVCLHVHGFLSPWCLLFLKAKMSKGIVYYQLFIDCHSCELKVTLCQMSHW